MKACGNTGPNPGRWGNIWKYKYFKINTTVSLKIDQAFINQCSWKKKKNKYKTISKLTQKWPNIDEKFSGYQNQAKKRHKASTCTRRCLFCAGVCSGYLNYLWWPDDIYQSCTLNNHQSFLNSQLEISKASTYKWRHLRSKYHGARWSQARGHPDSSWPYHIRHGILWRKRMWGRRRGVVSLWRVLIFRWQICRCIRMWRWRGWCGALFLLLLLYLFPTASFPPTRHIYSKQGNSVFRQKNL